MKQIACLALVLFTAGCVSEQSAHNGALRFLNAVPDGPRMSMTVDGNLRAAGYDFGAGTPFIPLRANTYNVKIYELLPVAADPATRTIVDFLPDLRVNDELNMIVVGEESANTVELLQVLTVTEGVPTGQSRIQFVHAAVGAPAVDAYVLGPSDAIASSVPIATGLVYKAASPQFDVNSGEVRIVLTAPGDPATILFDSGSVFLALQRSLLLTLIPSTTTNAVTRPFTVVFWGAGGSVTAQDITAQAQFRLVNASAGAYDLDVFLNATSVVATDRQVCDPLTLEETTALELCTVPYLSVGPFNSIGAGTYQTKIQKTGDAAVAPQGITGTFAPGMTTGVVTGFIPDDAVATSLFIHGVDGGRRIGTEAQLRVVDTSLAADNALGGDPTTDRLELYIKPAGAPLENETADFVGVQFDFDTGYVPELAGSYDVTLVKADTATPDAAPEIMLTQQVTLANNGIYTLLITDTIPAALPLQYLSIGDDPN